MKRWIVNLDEGKVRTAQNQASHFREYVVGDGVVFVRAVDELGAWTAANKMKKEQTGG